MGPDREAQVRCAAVKLMSATTTRAPSRAARRQTAAPIPDPPPALSPHSVSGGYDTAEESGRRSHRSGSRSGVRAELSKHPVDLVLSFTTVVSNILSHL